ncbi:D(2) dopamine receptor-like [Saccostrea cucullata]|uniref:D(2) dopamine receptor-like n=1 Tax=Saccostrea cuccullata TaxID=36930 RepID=UPI002ED04619
MTANQTLEELTSHAVAIRLPVRIFIGIVAVLGVIGNGHVLYLYYTRYKSSTYRWFVLSLAIIDLTGCCISMPFEIVDESLPYSFSDPISCKIFRYVNYCVALACAFTLLLIASERYRKICKPYENQMSETRAKKYVVAVIVTTLVISLPVLYIYGPKTIEINEIYEGKECTWGDHMVDHSTFGYAYAGFLTLLIVVCMICLTVIYSIIGYTLQKHERQIRARLDKNHRNSVKLNRACCSSSDLLETNSSLQQNVRLSHSCEQLPDSPEVHRKKFDFLQKTPIKFLLESDTEASAKCKKQQNNHNSGKLEETRKEGLAKNEESINSLNHSKVNATNDRSHLASNSDAKSSIKTKQAPARIPGIKRNFDLKTLGRTFPVERKERKITKVLVAITLLFIASFLPYVIVVIVFFINPEYENNMTSSQLVLYLLGFRLYNINNMANPIFYFLFDSKFREEFLSLYQPLCRSRRTKSLSHV